MMKVFILVVVTHLTVCQAGSMRGLNIKPQTRNDFVISQTARQTKVATHGNAAVATQKGTGSATNVIKEEVVTMCRHIHKLMPVHEGNHKRTCFRVKSAIAPLITSLSSSMAKTFSTSVSKVASTGHGVVCAKGYSQSYANQCVETLGYALTQSSWAISKVNQILGKMKPDFVVAFSNAESYACTYYGKASAYQTSLSAALDVELHKMFPLIHYGFSCHSYYSAEEKDKAQTVIDGHATSVGVGVAGTNGQAISGSGEDVPNIPNFDFDDWDFNH